MIFLPVRVCSFTYDIGRAFFFIIKMSYLWYGVGLPRYGLYLIQFIGKYARRYSRIMVALGCGVIFSLTSFGRPFRWRSYRAFIMRQK